MRFGIMAMQMNALIPGPDALSNPAAFITGFDHAGLVGGIARQGFNLVELGGDLVLFFPPEDAGKYLGISNLAGAGAGIVGTGIGGPMADFFNKLSPGTGYEVIYGIYGILFLISILVLQAVRKNPAAAQ